MRIVKIIQVSGEIEVVTGLHIGASKESIEIGGMDNPIVKVPTTGDPYIPGSSIKGKMRSLLEWYLGKISNSGNAWSSKDPNDDISRIFGVGNNPKDPFKGGPTRIIVRDAFITDDCKKNFIENGYLFTEDKYENSINRITSNAMPRPIERVVPGVKFAFEMQYRVMDIDGDNGALDEKYFDEVVIKGLKLIEMDALGGGGSRGNGKICFKGLKADSKNIDLSQVSL